MKYTKELLLFSIMVTFLLCLSGCGVKVNTKSPEGVAKSIVEAYLKDDENAVKKCFGLDPKEECADEITKEINYNVNILKAHEADKVKFTKSESLGNFNGYDMVYVIYNLEKKDKDSKKSEALEIPSLSLYFIQKKEKKYYVVPAKDVTEEMSKISSEQFAEFMKSEEYKTYEKEYKNFIRKNPTYEDTYKEKLSELSQE